MMAPIDYSPSIFLSHSSKDKAFVRQLEERLKGFDIYAWVDEAEILPGDSLIERISDAIFKIDYLGVVLSSHSVSSS